MDPDADYPGGPKTTESGTLILRVALLEVRGYYTCVESEKSKMNMEAMQVMMMAREQANPCKAAMSMY
jgi:hypothetical protein